MRIVVAGALIDDGRVLAARRTHPADLAGRWELPGGKVDAGESDETGLAREFAEELGVAVTVGGRIGPDVDLGAGTVLRCYRVEVVRGRPTAREHDELRWVGTDELTTLAWLPADVQLLDHLRSAMNSSAMNSSVMDGRSAGAGP